MGKVLFMRKGEVHTAPEKPVYDIIAGDLAVGSSVYLMENGTAVEYLVVNQGIPGASSLYDSSCNGTWLLRKDIYNEQPMNESSINTYGECDLRYYLNTTFYNLFDTNAKNAIINAKIPYNKDYTVYSGANGTSVYAFLLSYSELGCTRTANSSTTVKVTGSKLDYFDADPSGSYASSTKRIAYLSGTATEWYSRDESAGSNAFYYIGTGGRPENARAAKYECGVRPAVIINSNTLFDAETLILKGV